MKAMLPGETGIVLREVEQPAPKPSEILVRVRAAGLNRADLAASAARPAGGPPGAIPGLEWAGEIVSVGAEVTGFKPGDRVMCSGYGGYAEYAACDAGRAARIPHDTMSYAQAAVLPLALQTMHDAVVTNGRLKKGEAVLIHGASSGVGLMGLQIARHMGARLVIGTSTNPQRRARLTEFGADLALDPGDPGWADAVQQATGGKGADLIVDQVAGSGFNQTMRAAAVLGRIVNVGRLGGKTGEFDFDLHALKRLSYVGVTFRTRSVEEVRALVGRMTADLWDAVASGTLTLPIDRSFALDEAAAALAHMRANAHFGKIVLTM